MLSQIAVFVACALAAVNASPVDSASPEASSVVTSTFTGTRVMPTIISVEPFLASHTSIVVWTETFTASPTSSTV